MRSFLSSILPIVEANSLTISPLNDAASPFRSGWWTEIGVDMNTPTSGVGGGGAGAKSKVQIVSVLDALSNSDDSEEDDDQFDESDESEDAEGYLESMLDEHKSEPIVEIKQISKKPTFTNLISKFRPSTFGNRIGQGVRTLSNIGRKTELRSTSLGKQLMEEDKNGTEETAADSLKKRRSVEILKLKKQHSMSSRKKMALESRKASAVQFQVLRKDGPSSNPYDEPLEEKTFDQTSKEADVDVINELRWSD